MQFMDRPVEGGQNIPMFNCDKLASDDISASNNMDITQTTSRDTEPETQETDSEADSIEEELVRHHHAVLDGNKSSPVTSETNSQNYPDQIFESMSHDPNIQPIDEDELYEITVGDVIRDVLLTLRDNPEIVKELIASEKAKLVEQIDAYNQQLDDTDGEELSQDRLLSTENTNSAVQGAVDKSVGLSPTEDDTPQVNEKRADEVSNDVFTGEEAADDPEQFMQFMNRPVEGGQNVPMFNYDKLTSDDISASNNMDLTQTPSRDTESETQETDSENLNEGNFRQAFQLPFLNQFPVFRNYKSPNAGGSTNDRLVDESQDDSKTRETEGMDRMDSEEELAWLLQEGRHNQNTNKDEVIPRKH